VSFAQCKQKGWRFMRTIQIEKKGLAFAFWEDNYEFLTEEELKEATTENTAQDKPKASGPTNTPELFQEYQTNGESLGGRPPGKVFLGFCLKTGSMSR
jgi:hypothetical protein